MTADHYKLKEMSDADLHDWVCSHAPGTAEYNSGVLESMRRVAIIEEVIEKNRNPARNREITAVIIAVLSIFLIITAILFFL